MTASRESYAPFKKQPDTRRMEIQRTIAAFNHFIIASQNTDRGATTVLHTNVRNRIFQKLTARRLEGLQGEKLMNAIEQLSAEYKGLSDTVVRNIKEHIRKLNDEKNLINAAQAVASELEEHKVGGGILQAAQAYAAKLDSPHKYQRWVPKEKPHSFFH